MADTPIFQAGGPVFYVEVPTGYGKTFPSLVEQARKASEGFVIDWTALREAYLFARGRPFPVGGRGDRFILKEKAKVRFSENGLAAYIVFYPPKPKGERMEEAEVLDLLEAYGVAEELIELREARGALLRREYGEPILVARGSAPIDTRPVRIEMNGAPLPTDPEGFKETAEDIDIFPDKMLLTAKAGDTVGVRVLPPPGTPGITARGMILNPKPASDPNRLGSGLILGGPAGDQVIAQTDGHVRITGVGGIEASVIPVVEIEEVQELQKLMGQGFFPGSVVFHGDLEVNFPVKIFGDLEVFGSIIRTTTKVAGSVFVRDGIIESGRHPVVSAGVVSANFFDRAVVRAETVHLRRYSLHSQLAALDTVFGMKASSIMGGVCEAGSVVKAETLGAANGYPTRAVVGTSLWQPLVAAFQGWIEEFSAQFTERRMPTPFIEQIARIREFCRQDPSPFDGRVFAEIVHHGVTVTVGAMSRDVQDQIARVTFTLEKVGDKERIAMARR